MTRSDESNLHLYDDNDAPLSSIMQNLTIDDAVVLANKECLHGEPNPTKPTSSRARDKKAYVVFYGRQTGVFSTW